MAEENNEIIEKTEEIITDANEQSVGSEITENNNTENDGKSNDFDPSAFSEVSTPNPEIKDEKAIEKDSDGADGDGDDSGDADSNDFEWASYDDDENKENQETETESEVVEDKKDIVSEEVNTTVSDSSETLTPNEQTPNVSSENNFKQVAEELGLKFDDINEFKDHLVKLEERNSELEKANISGATSKTVSNLNKLKEHSNEELVRMDLEKQGFKGDDLSEAVDKIIDIGMIDIEARKIRNTIEQAIVVEQKKITNSSVDAEAKQKAQYEEDVKSLTEYIGNTETMFGFKMAKDEDSLKSVHKGHLNYITSGNFINDVTKNNENLVEAAWLWKNKDIIMKSIANKGLQQGKEEILNNIGEPEVSNTKRFKGPNSDDGFNPKAFTYGN